MGELRFSSEPLLYVGAAFQSRACLAGSRGGGGYMDVCVVVVEGTWVEWLNGNRKSSHGGFAKHRLNEVIIILCQLSPSLGNRPRR